MSAQPNEGVKQFVEIKNVGKRVHPQYDNKVELWNFLLSSYRGGMGMQGRAGMTEAEVKELKPNGYYAGLFRWPAESAKKYLIRVAMTPYTPYARRIVNTFVNYLTRETPERKGDEAYRDLYSDVNMRGMDMTAFVRHCLTMQRVLGEFNVLIDMPAIKATPVSRYEEVSRGIRPYAVALMPQNIVDWSVGANNRYEWVLVETSWMVSSVALEKPYVHTRRTYYDAEVWQVYDKDQRGKWELIESGQHPCGEVPVARITTSDFDFNPETPESWFYDLADMNREIYNLDSIDVENFQNQTHGQLILPADAEMNADAQGRRASASEAWTETPEENGISRYIQTTGIEHTSVKDKVSDRREEMFRLAGLYHRVQTRQVETADAKKWDHEEMNQFLAAFAETAEATEKEIVRIAGLWRGIKNATVDVTYKKDYSISDLESMVAAVLDLNTIGFASETGRKEALKRIYVALIGDHVDDATMNKIRNEIDASEQEDPLLALGMMQGARDENNE